MENMRNIKEKIRSCMSCNEEQCPFIKERLERHVLSHHSSSRQTISSQHTKRGRLSSTQSLKSELTMMTMNEQTSTSDLITEQLNKRAQETAYRQGLEEIAREWAMQLPKYHNESSENFKENIVNELVEKLSKLSPEVNEGYYDLKLEMEIDKFIESLPSGIPYTQESDFANLKDILIRKIGEFNKIKINKDKMDVNPKTIDNKANTQQSFKNNLKYLETLNDKTNIPYSSFSDNNESVTDLNFNDRPNEKKLVDAQVQQSISSFEPFYGNMLHSPIDKIDKQQNTDTIENFYKQIIFNWLNYLTIELDHSEKIIISEAILNRLKPLLNKKYTINDKMLLKAEILNCLNDYILLISAENYNHIIKISDDLAVNLLDAKFQEKEVNSILCNSYIQNSKDKMLPMNFEPENYFDIMVQKIVCEKIGTLNISNLIKGDIINIILQNMKLICMRQDHYIEALIFEILQNYTELTDYCISNIVKSILDQIRITASNNYVQIYNSVLNNASYKLCRPSLISVFKSEHEIHYPHNVSFERKSSLSNYSQLTEDEIVYIDKISELIKAWITILPTKGSKTVSKRIKELIIKNLARDILDQVKLEQIIPESKVEKDKYLSFFINRCLNRLHCFENISDAKPYAEKLIDHVKNIPTPPIPKNIYNNQIFGKGKSKAILTTSTPSRHIEYVVNRQPIKNNSHTNDEDHNIENTLKSEGILKEFITKYIEHNYDEDNPITREVFGHILKTELQKLSTPTRNKVHSDFNNQVDNIIASEKIAKELQYINIISDCFQMLPFENSFNVTGNKQLAQYVNDLAKIISDLEETRLLDADYNKHLRSTVSQFIDNLPIKNSYNTDKSFLIDDLIDKIASLRSPALCCAFGRDLSLNVSGIPDQNLTDFIEVYIRENSNEIADDDLKLDAWALRLLSEVDTMASENPSALCTSQVYNRLDDVSVQGDDIGKRFNQELSYAKEISNWLNNLPLQKIVDKSTKDLRIQMISNLAEKMSARWHQKYIDPNNTEVDEDLVDYIEKWIKALPLDHNKELILPLLTQQILNRMERVNTGKQTPALIQQEPQNDTIIICAPSCCDMQNSQKLKTLDPGGAIVDAIESWCQNLPIQSESESKNNTLKEEFSTKLYKKVGELNKHPDYFNNNFLYLQILGQEIDLGLDELPQNTQLQNTRQILKEQLLDIINKNRYLLSEKSAGVKYRQELAKTIETSLPNPGPLHPQHNPGFNIYKNRLTDLFILENFDYSQDNARFNYLKRLRNQLDKYFLEAQIMNSLPLTKEQMFNKLYTSLFSVPPPNETSIIEEVEEVKTRCEIESWFDELPIRKATSLDELFGWDQILSMLAKKLHCMEKYEKNYDGNIFKGIKKWLQKLPLVSGQEENINNFANKLQQRLKATFNDRMCTLRHPHILRQECILNQSKSKGVLGTSQVAGPSCDGMPWLSPPSSPMPGNLLTTPKKPSDLILDIVETWCRQLPLSENTQQEKHNAKLLKDNLVVKIITKISELNVNSETFENDILYDVILDDELDNLISTLPTSNVLEQNKTMLKNKLIDSIKSIKPLIMEEKARYEYKQELKNTVDQFLEQSPNSPPETVALFITLRDEIVDNFVAYCFCKDNKKGQEVHKMMIHKAVENYYIGKKLINSNELADPLIKGNQLLCELEKVPAPSTNVILEEIHEIRMKFQITDLFKELSFTDDENKVALKNQVKSTLARRLSDFNKTSFIQNHEKIRDDIMKCLHKIQNDIDPQKVEMFIKKLETSEYRRISQLSPHDKNNFPISYKVGEQFINNENVEGQQWLSLLPATPRVHDPNYHDTLEIRENRKSLGEVGSPQVQGHAYDHSISQSGINYDEFKGGELLSSSVLNKYQSIQSLSNSNDKPRVISDQGQSGSVGSSNGVLIQGYAPIDTNANRPIESSLIPCDNLSQPQNLESHNIQPRLTQEVGGRRDLQNTIMSPQPRDPDSQEQIRSQKRRKSYTFIQNMPPQNQSSQQSELTTPNYNENQMSISATKPQSKSVPASSQMTLQSQDKYQPIQSLSNSNNKARVISDQGQSGSVGSSNGIFVQGYAPVNTNANRSIESSLRPRDNLGQQQNLESHNIQPRLTQQGGGRPDLQNVIMSPQPRDPDSQEQIRSQKRRKSYTSIQYMPPQNQSSQQSELTTPNYNQKQMSISATKPQSKSVPASSQMTLQSQDKYQPIKSLSNSNDKARAISDQGQSDSVGSSNGIFVQGYAPVNTNANRSIESSLRPRDNLGQEQNLESHNIQPRLTQQGGGRPDLQNAIMSPQPRDPDSQEQIRSQKRRKSYTFIQNMPPQNQSSQQSELTSPNYNQNQMSISATKLQSKSVLAPSQMTLQSQDAPSQQNQFGTPSTTQQTPALQNIPGPCTGLPSDLSQPMPQFSSQNPYFKSKCNKSCRRPSITLLKQPEMHCNKNQCIRGNVKPISDDDENICLCTNKRRKQCRGSPICPVHLRKQCKICNGINPFYSPPQYHRYCRY